MSELPSNDLPPWDSVDFTLYQDEINKRDKRIKELEETINKFMDDWEDGGPMCKPFREVMKIENESI